MNYIIFFIFISFALLLLVLAKRLGHVSCTRFVYDPTISEYKNAELLYEHMLNRRVVADLSDNYISKEFFYNSIMRYEDIHGPWEDRCAFIGFSAPTVENVNAVLKEIRAKRIGSSIVKKATDDGSTVVEIIEQ